MRSTRTPGAGDGARDDGSPTTEDTLPPSGFELRLADGRAFVSVAGRPLVDGVVARRFRMEVPRIKFPFDVTGGADRFRDQRCLLRELELSIEASALARFAGDLIDLTGLADGALQLAPRPGFLELCAHHPIAGWFTARLAVEAATDSAEGRQLRLFFYDVRLYQPGQVSAAELLHRLGAQVRSPLERVDPANAGQLALDVLTPALRQLLVPRGFRVPETRGAGLRRVQVLTGQVVLEFEAQDLPSSPPLPEELLAREGQRAFAEVETLIARGELGRAREALRDLSQAEAHPFAAERLLQLLVSDPADHDLALDLCALLRRRAPVPAAALWVEGVIREANEEWLKAASCFLDLAELSLGERALFSAALAARRAAELAVRSGDAGLATRAYGLWESAVPNDVDALLGLAGLAERGGDLATALGTLRRVSAFAPDGAVSAAAHARLGKLLLEKTDDVARARLHLDQALRQNPSDLPSLLALAESCERSGELVRTVRLLDRAAGLMQALGDTPGAIRLLERTAVLWETKLARPENGLLRLREALSLEATDGGRRALWTSIARISQAIGLQAEALAALRSVARFSPPGRLRAEAFLTEARLLGSDAALRQAADLAAQQALREDPGFIEAARELVQLRRGGSPLLWREALSRTAEIAVGAERAKLLIERGDLETQQPELGESPRQSFALALKAEPGNREALGRLAAAAEAEGDAAGAAEALQRIAEAAETSEERLAALRRVAEVASRISDPLVVVRLLRTAARSPDAPLEVLVRLLDLERQVGLPEAGISLALRVSEAADATERADLALDVLLAEIDRVQRQEEVERVRPLLNRLLELAPHDAKVRAAAVRLFRLEGDLEALRPALEAYLQTAEAQPIPRQLQIWRELAEVSLGIGQRREAIAAYQALHALDPEDRDAAEALVDLQTLEGDRAAQVKALLDLSALLARQGDSATAAQRLLTLAVLEEPAAPQLALAHLQAAVALDRSPGTLTALATLAERQQDFELAAETLEALGEIEAEPRLRAVAFRSAARVVLAADRALALGLAAHAADPSLPWGRLLAALVALSQQDFDAARDLSAGLLSDTSDETSPLGEGERDLSAALLAAAARALGDAATEDRALDWLESRDPGEWSYAVRRLELLRQLGGSAEELSARLGRVASRLAPEIAADSFVGLGQLQAQAGRSVEAAAAFAEALVLHPDRAEAILGLLTAHPKDAPERAGLRARLLSLPAAEALLSPQALGALFVEEASAREHDEAGVARQLWQRAFDLLPDDSVPAAALARICEKEGDLAQAASAYLALANRLGDEAAGEPLLAAVDLLDQVAAVAEAAATLAAGLARPLPSRVRARGWLRMAELQRKLGDRAAELAALDQAIGLSAAADRASLHLKRAALFEQAGDREAERTALTQALLGGASGVDLLLRLRSASEALGDGEAVAEALELLIQAQAGQPALATQLAYELGELAEDRLLRPRRAEAAYRRALAFQPAHAPARSRLAELMIARGDAESIERGLDLLVQGLPLLAESDRREATVALAIRAARQLQRPDFGVRLLRSLADDLLLSTAGRELGAELLYDQGATEEALRWIALAEASAELSDEARRAFALRQAELLADLGREATALTTLDSLLDTPPFAVEALDQLVALMARGHSLPDDRIEAIALGIRHRSLAARLLTVHAAQRLAHDPQAAAAELRVALDLDPTPDRLAALKRALAAAGDNASLITLIEADAQRAAAGGDAAGAQTAWTAVAEVARRCGDRHSETRALAALIPLLREGPESELGETLNRLAELLGHAGDQAQALSLLLEAARRGSPGAASRAEGVARELGDARGLAEALEQRLAGVAGFVPGEKAALFGELSSLYRGPLDAPELAERTLRRALDLGEAPSEGLEALIEMLRSDGRRREVAGLLSQKAQALLADGRPEDAAQLFDRAADELCDDGARAQALTPLRAAVAAASSPERLLALADELQAQGELREAASIDAELCDSQALPPFRALERRREFLHASGDARSLAEFLERFASATQSQTAWLLEAAGLRGRLGDSAEELRDLVAAFDGDPAHPEAFAALVARGSPGDSQAWASLLRRRAAAVPAEAGSLLRSAADLLLHEGHLAAAAETYEAALAATGDEPLALAGRIEVAAAQGETPLAWVPRLERALTDTAISEGTAGEAMPRAVGALLAVGAAQAAQALLKPSIALPQALRDGPVLLDLRDRVATAVGDRSGQLEARRALLALADVAGRRDALARVLEVVRPADPGAVEILREAFETEGRPHSVALADRLGAALEATSAYEPLAALLEELTTTELLPTPTSEERLVWLRRAGEVRWLKLGQREQAAANFSLAQKEAGDSLERLRELATAAQPPEARLLLLAALAARVSPAERSPLLLERAQLAEDLALTDAASAWEAVLREGPDGAGYAQALERALARAEADGREADVANLLVAQADATPDGQARAQLLVRAAQILEQKLSEMSGALELYRRAAAESGEVRWFTILAEAFDRAGRTAEAAAAMAVEVARREPGERRRERQRKLGLMLASDLGRPAEALPHLRAVIEAEEPPGTDDQEVLETLAACARAVGDADLELLAISRLRPRGERADRTQRELRRATLLQQLARDAEAGAVWAALLKDDPGNPDAFEALATQLRERKAWRGLADLLGRHLEVSLELSVEARVALLIERARVLSVELADPDAGERLYREALALAPRAAQALDALRKMVDARGDHRGLAQLLEGQLGLADEDSEIAPLALQLGGLELRLGDPRAARTHLRQALAAAERAAPTFVARLRLPLAQVEMALGDFRAALEQAEAGLVEGADRPALLQLAGQAALNLGARLRALGYVRDLLDLQPVDPIAMGTLEQLSRLTAEAGEASESPAGADPGIAAEALMLRIAHEEDPARKARALRDLAEVRQQLGDPVAFEAALREAVRLDPDAEEGFQRLRALLEAESRFQDLAEVLRERARGTTDEVVRAASLAEQGDLLRGPLHNPAGAAEAYQRSLEILPRAPTSEGYAEALFALGQDELAAEHYRRALSGGGHLGEFFLLYRLGEIARRSGDRGGALEQFRRSSDANPSFLPAREALVEIAEELGKPEVALIALRGALSQLDPVDFAEQLAETHLKIAELERRVLHVEAAADSLEKAAQLLPHDPRPLERLAVLYQNAARWPDAVRVLEQLAALVEGAAAASPLAAAGEISLERLADMERAATLFERALQAAPAQESALRRLLEISAASGQSARLTRLAEPLLTQYLSPTGAKLKDPPAWLAELFLPLSKAFEQVGQLEDAQRVLSLARPHSAEDLSLLTRQADLARQSGRFGDEADLEEQLVARILEQRPLEAATRLRALARRVLERLSDDQRTRRLLEQAATLAPARTEDRRLLADLWRRSGEPDLQRQALEIYLSLVRRDPVLDLVLLRTLAAAAETVDRPELSQIALSLVAALEKAPLGPALTLSPLPQSAWSLGFEGGLDLVLQKLAPYLEPLFPVMLGRYGVISADRVGPGHAPELHQWVERARESLGARPVDVYLAPGLKGVSVENSHPPSLIVGTPALQALGQASVQWLLCQRLSSIELGLTLPAKFSPRDVVTLASLVALLLTDEAPVPAEERQRLQAFLGALRRACPEPVRQGLLDQVPQVVRELQIFDPSRYLAQAAAKANHLALLVTGDLRSALHALAYLEGGQGATGQPWELAQGRELIAWAFSDEHLALRRLALGKTSR